jgi:hypothetical protein
MTTENTGGPAFPEDVNPGMTLRDYFAAKAMQGMLAGWPNSDSCFEHMPTICKKCYQWADMMLKARVKK